MKSAMRAALKESLLGMKKDIRHERAKSHLRKGGEDADMDSDASDSPKSGAGTLAKKSGGVQGSGERLREKVGMAETEARHEMEEAGESPEEEASESQAEENAEWRSEQSDFMKNRSKPSGKVAAKFVSVITPNKDKPGNKKSSARKG